MQAASPLCSHAATALYLQGALIAALLAVGWAWTGYVRLCELRRQRLLAQHAPAGEPSVQRHASGKSSVQRHASGDPKEQRHTASYKSAPAAAAFGRAASAVTAGRLDDEECAGGKGWPGVSVVLPVKGCRAHSERNWRSQLAQRYAGPLEFLFVVDDAADAAVAAIQKLLSAKGLGVGAGGRIVIAPHAVRSSQKIANLQAGIRTACTAHKWVLCLDDDIELHPRSLADLVAAAEADPTAFMATGLHPCSLFAP